MKKRLVFRSSAGRLDAATAETLKRALSRADELGIRHIVVASTTGATALRLAKLLRRHSAVCVTHHAGFARPGQSELPAAVEAALARQGIRVLRTSHLFAGIDRAVRLKFGGLGPAEAIANTYRTLGEGVKVAVEISVMALDAGLVPFGRDIVAIGGTGTGADAAIVVRPAHAKDFFDTKVKEVICKPATW